MKTWMSLLQFSELIGQNLLSSEGSWPKGVSRNCRADDWLFCSSNANLPKTPSIHYMGNIRFLLTKHLSCQVSGQMFIYHKALTFIPSSYLLLSPRILFVMDFCDTSSLFGIKEPLILMRIWYFHNKIQSRVNFNWVSGDSSYIIVFWQ